MSLTRSAGRQALMNTWQALASEADETLQGHINHLFYQLRRAVCEGMALDAVRFSRLGDSDERAYDQLTRLMDAYREAVGLIESQGGSFLPAADGLLAGINEILTSRLRQFEDMATSNSNPVVKEKRGIIERALLYTAYKIENIAGRFAGKVPPAAWAALRGAFLMESGHAPQKGSFMECEWHALLIEYLRGYGFAEMYDHYREGLRFCLLGLDDLHGRKTARFYTELIESEWGILRSLIGVQAAALEEALTVNGGNPPHPPAYGEPAPERVLNILREVYQQTGPFVENLQRLPQAAPRAHQDVPCRSFEEFAEPLAGYLQIEIDHILDVNPFLEALAAETAALFEQQRIAFLKAAYRFQRMVGEEILLAEEAAALFARAFAGLKERDVEVEETERQILSGIAETLEIKIEGLRESIHAFNNEGAGILQSFAKEKIEITDEAKKAAALAIRDAWLAGPPADAAELPGFFERCHEGEAFAPYRAGHEKQVNHYTAKVEKASLRFRKDILLYEVCTYEEILTHSVSRLRASANGDAVAAAKALDEVHASLEILLKKNNIIPIRPAPHDIFNGKEHEVLVAERQEGFAKGEIIKLVGSGYRYKDRVLMRANVIAAR